MKKSSCVIAVLVLLLCGGAIASIVMFAKISTRDYLKQKIDRMMGKEMVIGN